MSAGVEVEVAPLLPVRGTFTYRVEEEAAAAAVRPGARVLVPFGARQVVGMVLPPGAAAGQPALRAVGAVRAVSELLDWTPVLPEGVLALLVWAARYYYAPVGELVRAALPALLHARERQQLQLTASGRAVLEAQAALLRRPDLDASAEELALLQELDRRGGSLKRSARGWSRARTAALNHAVASGWVVQVLRRSSTAPPSTDLLITLSGEALPGDLERRAPRQAALYAQLAAVAPSRYSALSALPTDARALLRRLEQKGLVRCVLVDREPTSAAAASPAEEAEPGHTLTLEQAAALRRIEAALQQDQYRAFLLHGITGSGKTEVYLRAIAEALARGRTALVLVPEIALTPQLAQRFRARFGDQVAVLHSGLADRQRYDEWQRIRAGVVRIVVGARSAVFAPLEQLGVVVLDEEHDGSFKQDEGVRYNARDLALVRAKDARAVAVLGSATPSLESYHGALTGRLELLEMMRRATPRPLPPVRVIDLRRYQTDASGLISAPLDQALRATLAAGQQAILFLNRRGFSTFVVCRSCGEVCQCAHCSVSLTHHRRRALLVCHYCGFTSAVPRACAHCKAEPLALLGHGTERIEDALQQRFPAARVARLDRDTASGRGLQELLARTQRRELDILVGTQMVTKGHDFPHVTLVGVLSADRGLNFPDFRAAERTFQLLTQVAGRAGRGDAAGEVLIQTYAPEHPAIRAAQQHDYRAFYEREQRARRELGYPPFGVVAALHLDGPDAPAVAAAAQALGRRITALSATQGVELLGPAEAPLQRLKGRTRWLLLLKAKQRGPLRELLDRLLPASEQALPRDLRLAVDIDPQQML
ncbi:MAG: primosomal protein N' [Proteobacteria bacterium]|nr:primosomal protein N' [Pseudomonadota bacterium]